MAEQKRDDDPRKPSPAPSPAAPTEQAPSGDPAPRMAFAVHTATCAYLLDEDGVCHWIVARHGAVPPHVRQCVGAQFVACLDLAAQGGLVPQLRVGAMALFVRTSDEGRLVLLRTAPIQRVDGADGKEVAASAQPSVPFGDLAAQPAAQYGKRAGIPLDAPPPDFSSVLDWGTEQTVTVTRPSQRRPDKGGQTPK